MFSTWVSVRVFSTWVCVRVTLIRFDRLYHIQQICIQTEDGTIFNITAIEEARQETNLGMVEKV